MRCFLVPSSAYYIQKKLTEQVVCSLLDSAGSGVMFLSRRSIEDFDKDKLIDAEYDFMTIDNDENDKEKRHNKLLDLLLDISEDSVIWLNMVHSSVEEANNEVREIHQKMFEFEKTPLALVAVCDDLMQLDFLPCFMATFRIACQTIDENTLRAYRRNVKRRVFYYQWLAINPLWSKLRGMYHGIRRSISVLFNR